MRAPLRALRRFRRDRRGVSGVEFAMTVPLLILLMLGVAELGRYGVFRMKLGNTVANVADIVARAEAADRDEIDELIATAPVLLRPFDQPERLRILVSAVQRTGSTSPPRVAWRRAGGQFTAEPSRIGLDGADATIPDDLLSEAIGTLIVCEIMYDYEPWLLGFVVDHVAYDVAFLRPRRAELAALE